MFSVLNRHTKYAQGLPAFVYFTAVIGFRPRELNTQTENSFLLLLVLLLSSVFRTPQMNHVGRV